MSKLTFLSIILFFLFCNKTYSQTILPDTSESGANLRIAAYYHKLIGQSSGLFNGREYKYHSPDITGTPFFFSNDWSTGTVIYNQVFYTGVKMRYDIVDDQLTALLFNEALPYILNRSEVASFDIQNHHFVYIPLDTLQKNNTGRFYEQLYKRKTEVLIKYNKDVATSTTSTGTDSRYIDAQHYYLVNKKIFYPVSGNSSVTEAFQDRKAEIQQFLKSNRIKIKPKKFPGEALVRIATYYDTLTN